MKELLKLIFALLIICLISALFLSIANQITQKPIEEARSARLANELKLLLPEFNNSPVNEKQNEGKFEWMLGKLNENVTGIAVRAFSNSGYGGKIVVVVGFKPDGEITKVNVVEHKETPGLGTNVTDRVTKLTIFDIFHPEDETKKEALPPSVFLDQFSGKKAQDIVKAKLGEEGLNGISGATVSSNATLDAVGEACKVFEKIKVKGEIK